MHGAHNQMASLVFGYHPASHEFPLAYVLIIKIGGGDALNLTAGQQADLNRQGVIARADTPQQRPDWADGRLAFSKAPLTEVVERLARHRPGLLTLDHALAAPDAPRFTGVLPANDSDAALALLADTLNLEVRYLTPWYVTVRRR